MITIYIPNLKYAEFISHFEFMAKTWNYNIFQYCQYSGRREASVYLSKAIICPLASLVWHSDLAIENALQG